MYWREVENCPLNPLSGFRDYHALSSGVFAYIGLSSSICFTTSLPNLMLPFQTAGKHRLKQKVGALLSTRFRARRGYGPRYRTKRRPVRRTSSIFGSRTSPENGRMFGLELRVRSSWRAILTAHTHRARGPSCRLWLLIGIVVLLLRRICLLIGIAVGTRDRVAVAII